MIFIVIVICFSLSHFLLLCLWINFNQINAYENRKKTINSRNFHLIDQTIKRKWNICVFVHFIFYFSFDLIEWRCSNWIKKLLIISTILLVASLLWWYGPIFLKRNKKKHRKMFTATISISLDSISCSTALTCYGLAVCPASIRLIKSDTKILNKNETSTTITYFHAFKFK